MRDRFDLLTSGRRTALPRHRTLRATLDWSYQLLSGAERELLCRLAIFVGPFSLDAAYAVVADGSSHAEIADSLAGLVGKSLVFRATDPATAEFRLLETTRVYAMDRLTESGALTEVARRHATYFLRAHRTLDEERRANPQQVYLATFRRRANEVHVGAGMGILRHRRPRDRTGTDHLGGAFVVRAVPDGGRRAAAWNRPCRMPSRAPMQEMRLRIALGHALWYLGPGSPTMEATFDRALEIAERIGATDARTQALWGMWAARRGRGDYPAALDMARRYADAAANAGNVSAMHLGDRILGLTHHFMGHHAIARGFAERALGQPAPL